MKRQVFHYRTTVPLLISGFLLLQSAFWFYGFTVTHDLVCGWVSLFMLILFLTFITFMINSKIVVESDEIAVTNLLGVVVHRCRLNQIRDYNWKQLKNLERMTIRTTNGEFVYWSGISNEGSLTEIITDQIAGNDEIVASSRDNF